MSYPPSQAVEAPASGGPSREPIVLSVITGNGRQAGARGASRMTGDASLIFPGG